MNETKKDIILDFNDLYLKFSLDDIDKYRLNTIYNNIERFKVFINNNTKDDNFEQIYNTTVFQVTLLSPETSEVENVLTVYNALAQSGTINNKIYPILSKTKLLLQLKKHNYKVKRTTVSMGNSTYKKINFLSKD